MALLLFCDGNGSIAGVSAALDFKKVSGSQMRKKSRPLISSDREANR
jgi:hypothetical protein